MHAIHTDDLDGVVLLLGGIVESWRGVEKDQDFLAQIAPGIFKKHGTLRALLTNDSLRAAFLMRLASRGGVCGRVARTVLITAFSCDVSAGASIEGALHIPHPVGIVIGEGVHLRGNLSIFQHVTLGSDGRGGYPSIERDVRIFPNSVVVGDISVGAGARIAAGSFVSQSLRPGQVHLRESLCARPVSAEEG